jgi:hypothetical protein
MIPYLVKASGRTGVKIWKKSLHGKNKGPEETFLNRDIIHIPVCNLMSIENHSQD